MGKPLYRKYVRTLRLNFYTSSVDKLLQARLLFSEHGYDLGFYRGRREPYDEDYSSTTENLLTRGVEFVSREFGLRSPFFIEDTSIRIEALSADQDFPGMRAKEWFAETKFSELDTELRSRSNDRRAVVKSDIALHLPNFSRPIFFHGETTGTVAATPPRFSGDPLYPWLTDRTFNGWFVPDGQIGSLRLGEMEYENSLAYDFRVRSLTKLIEYYDQLNAALNVPLAFVDTRRPAADGGVQLSLSFQPTKPVLCVIGEKCAGKSTLANALIKEHDAIHIEASTLFGEVASEVGKDFSSDSEVLGFLASAGYNTVARKVVDRLVERSDRMTVITGLRTPEEINYLQDHVDDLVVVWVSAEQRLRYERHLRRQRDPSLQTYRAFAVRDEAQRSFGALRFSSEIADYTVANNGSREEYLQKVKILADEILRGGGLDRDVDPGRFEDYRCLLALQRLGRVATCEEISDETARIAERVRLYNANRALKAVPEFADRIERKGRRLSYSPTERTAAAISLLERRRSRSPAG